MALALSSTTSAEGCGQGGNDKASHAQEPGATRKRIDELEAAPIAAPRRRHDSLSALLA